MTVRDCFTFRFVSLGEGGQIASMLGAKKKWRRKKGRKAEAYDEKNEEEKGCE